MKKVVSVVACLLALGLSTTTIAFAANIKFTVKPGSRLVIHGARNGCDGRLPSLRWAQSQVIKARLSPAFGTLAVGSAPSLRFSKSCGKAVPVLPITYQASSTSGKVSFTIFGDKITIVVK